MPVTDKKSINCILCNKRTKPIDRRPVSTQIRNYLQKNFLLPTTARDVTCGKCRLKHYLSDVKTNKQKDECFPSSQPSASPMRKSLSTTEIHSPPSVHLKIPATAKSHARCFICKKPGPKLIVASSNARMTAFVDCNIIIAAGSRCCPSHLESDVFKPDIQLNVPTTNETMLNRSTVLDMLSSLRIMCSRNNGRLSFEHFSSDDFLNMTGLSKASFDDICLFLQDKMRNSPVRSVTTTIGIFFFKLRSGLSNRIISTIFALSLSSLRRGISTVRQLLVTHFVPLHLGFGHISRQEVIEHHTRPLAQSFFGTREDGDIPKLILVLDGTYIYIQKSNNFTFQRRTFSIQKGRPLIKPMVIVTTTGYYLSIVGPYLSDSRNSDAHILTHMLKTNIEDIKSYVNKEDVFVVDRGFRDSVEMLEDLGIKAEMPAFMVKGQRQLSTEDANASRLVTKIRWVVESANARIKKWKYLDKVLPTNQVPYIGDFVRIVCAVSNKYLPPLSSSHQDDNDLAKYMLNSFQQVNHLKELVESNNLDRKTACWQSVDSLDLESFPRLSEEKLRTLTCGVYQLKLSPYYIQEHLNGICDIFVHIENTSLIRVKMQSRHSSSKQYLLWLKYDQDDIQAWYCKCRAGARVVGVCSHVAAVIWFLGYARYRYLNVSELGVRNWALHLNDACHVPEPVDESDSDSSV